MQPTVTPALLLIADISGFTRFMLAHDKELVHSQMIIGGLIEALMKEVDRPLTVLELEGDALFMYAPKTADEEAWKTRSQHLFERMMHLFETFDQRLAELAAYSVCHCGACSSIGDLRLKIVAHSGEVLVTRVDRFPVLSGPNVITVHRLLKNSVEAEQYLLMSASAYRDLPVPPEFEVRPGVEEYDVGRIETFHFVPPVRRAVDRDALLRSFSDHNVAMKILRHEVQKEYSGSRRSRTAATISTRAGRRRKSPNTIPPGSITSPRPCWFRSPAPATRSRWARCCPGSTWWTSVQAPARIRSSRRRFWGGTGM